MPRASTAAPAPGFLGTQAAAGARAGTRAISRSDSMGARTSANATAPATRALSSSTTALNRSSASMPAPEAARALAAAAASSVSSVSRASAPRPADCRRNTRRKMSLTSVQGVSNGRRDSAGGLKVNALDSRKPRRFECFSGARHSPGARPLPAAPIRAGEMQCQFAAGAAGSRRAPEVETRPGEGDRAVDPRPVAELRQFDPHAVNGEHADPLGQAPPDRVENQVAERGDAAAQDHQLRMKRRHDICDADADERGRPVNGPADGKLAGARRLGHGCRAHEAGVAADDLVEQRGLPAAQQPNPLAGNRGPARHGLEAAAVPASAEGPVGQHRLVAYLPGGAKRPQPQLPVDDQPAADPRAEHE